MYFRNEDKVKNVETLYCSDTIEQKTNKKTKVVQNHIIENNAKKLNKNPTKSNKAKQKQKSPFGDFYPFTFSINAFSPSLAADPTIMYAYPPTSPIIDFSAIFLWSG